MKKEIGEKAVLAFNGVENGENIFIGTKQDWQIAQELEQEAMSNLETAKEVKAEWEQGCEHCVKGVYYEADGEDDVCPIECPYCVAT